VILSTRAYVPSRYRRRVSIPAGWYPDPAGSTQQRWWDGTQWTGHLSGPAPLAQPYAQQAYQAPRSYIAEQLRAPDGTRTGTVWIWLTIFVPLLGVLLGLPYLLQSSSFYTGMIGTFAQNGASGATTLPPEVSAEIYSRMSGLVGLGALATVGGWVSAGLGVLFGGLDWRELRRRGVPRPFHWAWGFFGALVYVIGRDIVARRRTGSGMAAMWVAIAVNIVLFVAVIVFSLTFVSSIFDSATQASLSYGTVYGRA